MTGYLFVTLVAMSTTKVASSSAATGYEPPAKKQKLMLKDADRAETHLLKTQPGRVPLHYIAWHPANRGGQGIMPMHAHDVALDVCTNGTSERRCGIVNLVEVPEAEKEKWLEVIARKCSMSPLLSNLKAMSHTGTLYATLRCTHFVEAHKLIK